MAFYNTNILIWIFIYDFEYINEYSVSKLTFLLKADKSARQSTINGKRFQLLNRLED